MTRLRLIKLLIPLAVLLAVVGVAQAFYHSEGDGGGSASVGTLNPPTAVQATSPVGTDRVDVSWTASSTAGSATAPTGYRVSRSDGVTNTFVCGTSASTTIPATTCSDTGLGDGDYTYTVTAVFRSWRASATSNSATVTSPSITLSPTSGNVGSPVSISGSHFPPSSAVTATYAGNSVSLTPSTNTNGSGSFSGGSFNVPASTAGAHTVQVTVSGRSASASFTVEPAITLSPTTGVAGTSASISGTGFAASDTVTADFGGSAVALSGGSTNSNGSFSGATYTVPNKAPGSHTVSVTDGGANSASASFSIPTPSITLSPTSGNVGSTPTISGANFPAGSSVSATYDGSAVTIPSTSTNGSGSFTGASFTVPESPAGAHPVVATAGGRSAGADYTVTPSITLTPNHGLGGSTDQISGKGFAAGSAISATFNGSPVTLSSTTSDANGSFSGASYTVPDITAGSYTVAASDAGAHSANASFLIDPHVFAFVIGNVPASATAGTAITGITITAKKDGVTEAGYTGTRTLSWTGGSNSPSGATPTYPTNPVTFSSGVATVNVTLVKAGNETVNVSEGAGATQHQGSFNTTVNAAPRARLFWNNAAVNNGTLTPNPCLFTCTGAAIGNGKTFTAGVSLRDTFGNLVANTGTTINVTVTAPAGQAGDPNGTVTLPGGAITIVNGASSSAASATVTTPGGNWQSVIPTAAASGLTSVTATLNKN